MSADQQPKYMVDGLLFVEEALAYHSAQDEESKQTALDAAVDRLMSNQNNYLGVGYSGLIPGEEPYSIEQATVYVLECFNQQSADQTPPTVSQASS